MRGSGVLLIAVVLLGACGGATRAVVRDSLDEGTREDNWHKLRDPIRELAGEVARGVLKGASSADLASSLDASVDRFVRTVLRAASDGLGQDVSPAMAHAVRATVDEALAAILSDGTKRGVSEITDALTAAAMAGIARGIREQIAPALANALDTNLGPAIQRVIENSLGPAIAATLRRDLGPAFAATLQRDLGPAIAATLQRDLGPAFAAMLQHDLGPAFAATLQRDLGPAFAATLQHDLTPALVNAARLTSTAAGEGLQDGLRGAKQDAYSILRVVLVVMLAIVTGVLSVLLWLRHRAAKDGRDALHLVTSEIGRMSAEPVIVELARRIKTAGEGQKAGAFLADHLRSHPSIKVKPPLQA